MSHKRFCKSQRVLKREEFRRVLNDGVRKKTRHFIVFLMPNLRSCHRLGIIVTRKIGKAVQRNRIKRLLREFFRGNFGAVAAGLPHHDIVFIAKRGHSAITLEDIQCDIEDLYEKHLHRDDLAIPAQSLSSVA